MTCPRSQNGNGGPGFVPKPVLLYSWPSSRKGKELRTCSVSGVIGSQNSQSKLSRQSRLLKAPGMSNSTTLSCVLCPHCTTEAALKAKRQASHRKRTIDSSSGLEHPETLTNPFLMVASVPSRSYIANALLSSLQFCSLKYQGTSLPHLEPEN